MHTKREIKRKRKKERLFICVKIKKKKRFYINVQLDHIVSAFLNVVLRRKKLGPHCEPHGSRAGSPGRCGQASSLVRPSLGRESHKDPVYIWVRSFASSFSLSSFPDPASSPAPTRLACADTRYPTTRNSTVCLVKHGVVAQPVYATPTLALGQNETS